MLCTFNVTIMGYTMIKVTGMIICLSGAASNRYPQRSPRSMDTGMDHTRFFCSTESMFHMVIFLSDVARLLDSRTAYLINIYARVEQAGYNFLLYNNYRL
jgi:hypothetical protein